MIKRLILLLLFVPALLAADNTPVLQRMQSGYDPAIPSLKSVLGYDYGERITSHSDMVTYLETLQKATSRLKLQKTGETYEGRALYYAVISSEENMSRLEELRQANRKLADPRILSASDAESIIRANPVFVCLSFSVHGSEHSGVEAGLALAYYLLASNDVEIKELMKNVVVLIDPMQNPDGRERFIRHFYSTSTLVPSPDRNAAEHHESWPGGRYNHYLFDMNRDWTVLSQKETQARIKAYQEYFPEIFIDVHEMTSDSSYFFPPPTIPQNPNLPASTKEWWNRLGKAVAAEFDSRGIEYFTQERFDFWYPGYGDSWPTYNGSLAGTFEQASVRGLVRKRSDGKVVHYQDAISHHFLSTLAVCKMASVLREDKLRDFYQFRATAVEQGKTGPVRQYVISRASDPSLADRLVEKLLWQGIELRQADADFQIKASDYLSGQNQMRQFKKGDYIISLAQPLKRLIQALFEKETLPDKKFLDEEVQRRKDREPTEFYDISAWSLPLAYGLDAYWSGDPPPQASVISTIAKNESTLEKAVYAYLLNYDSNEAIVAASEFQRQKLRVYFSTRPFTAGGKAYRAGSFIVKVKDNPENLQQMLAEISKQTGLKLDAVHSGWTEEGPDLSSSDVLFLEPMRVAVLTHMPVDPTSYGAIQYLMEQRYGIVFTPLQAYMVGAVNLSDYNVILMPDESSGWGTYDQMIGKEGMKKLKAWVEVGGTLIAIQGAASNLIEKWEISGVKRISRFLKATTEPVPEKKKDEDEDPEEETDPADEIPGAIARVMLNRKHFLTFGYGADEIPAFVYSSNVFVVPPDQKAVVVYAEADRLKISGLIWEMAAKRLEKKAYLTEESVGDGHLILFAEDPGFRSYWEGLQRLLFNGMLFGPSI